MANGLSAFLGCEQTQLINNACPLVIFHPKLASLTRAAQRWSKEGNSNTVYNCIYFYSQAMKTLTKALTIAIGLAAIFEVLVSFVYIFVIKQCMILLQIITRFMGTACVQLISHNFHLMLPPISFLKLSALELIGSGFVAK